MLKLILAVVLFLAPHLEHNYVQHYARIIRTEARKQHIDPLLVATIIHVETARSWKMSLRSPTHDFGLMQVHVSRNSNSHLLGFEEVLFDPATNIRYGVGVLAMWRNYHQKNCDDADHPFWSHYQWGYKVRDMAWSLKVATLYNRLIGMFRSPSAPGKELEKDPLLATTTLSGMLTTLSLRGTQGVWNTWIR